MECLLLFIPGHHIRVDHKIIRHRFHLHLCHFPSYPFCYYQYLHLNRHHHLSYFLHHHFYHLFLLLCHRHHLLSYLLHYLDPHHHLHYFNIHYLLRHFLLNDCLNLNTHHPDHHRCTLNRCHLLLLFQLRLISFNRSSLAILVLFEVVFHWIFYELRIKMVSYYRVKIQFYLLFINGCQYFKN